MGDSRNLPPAPPPTPVQSQAAKRCKEPKNLFPDANAMKDILREQMVRRYRYDVREFYHTTGFTQWVARHSRFENLTLAVIGLNALWIWIDTDFNPGGMLLTSPGYFQVAEHFFCMYFTFEWTMRFCAFRKKCNVFRDTWFIFDSLLVLTMVVETWVMTLVFLALSDSSSGGGASNASILRMARLLRLVRMARMLRLLRIMPELLILIKGMFAAMRSVGFTFGLLGLILYIFGVAFVQLCSDSECEVLFPDVPNTMHSLLLNVALTDGLPSLIEPLQEQSIFLMLLMYLFVFFAALTLMNMLIGVICEVVSTIAATEREALNLNFVRDKIEELMGPGAPDCSKNDKLISKDELLELLTNEEACAILQDVGVDVVGLVDIADTIFAADPGRDTESGSRDVEKKLTFSDFMGLVLDLRGSNTATVRDMVNMRKYIDGCFSRLEKRLSKDSSVNSDVTHDEEDEEDETKLAALKLEMEKEVQAYSCLMQKALGSGQAKPEVQPLDFFKSMRNLLTFHESEVAAMRTENHRFHEQTATGLLSKTQTRDARLRSWEEEEELVACSIPAGTRPWAQVVPQAKATTDTVIPAPSPTRIVPDGVSSKPMVSLLPLPVPDLANNQCEEQSNSTASPRWPEFEDSVPLEAVIWQQRR